MWRISPAGRLDRLTVFKHLGGAYVPAGELSFEGQELLRPGKFQYAQEYLKSDTARAIDPIGLPLGQSSYQGIPEVPPAFLDAGPEGWGRQILSMAFEDTVLGAGEFLAAGSTSRTGDLSFGISAEAGPGSWRPDDTSSPQERESGGDLEALMMAAMSADEGNATSNEIMLLVRACSDVGGARPKVRWRDREGEWIAKFSTWGDKFDDPRVEAVCLDIAEAAGLPVPERQILTYAGRSVLLVRRFDRSEDGKPYAYLSMGTLLQEPPGSYGTSRTYTDMAAVARAIGVPEPEEQMFRRLLVNAFLHNTDDHLRNFAVIDKGEGWEISPVFDVVPYLGRKRHVCAPSPGTNADCDPHAAFSSYASFGLTAGQAETVRGDVIAAMRRLPEFLDHREVCKADRNYLEILARSN